MPKYDGPQAVAKAKRELTELAAAHPQLKVEPRPKEDVSAKRVKKIFADVAREILERRVKVDGEDEVKDRFTLEAERLLASSKESVRLAILGLLVEHGHGKPVQQVQNKVETTHYVIEGKEKSETVEEWMKEFGKPVSEEAN